MIQTDVAVIGGGAAGLMAAIASAGCNADTLILEHMDRVGKKILATGNGKCNYTNALQGVSYYRGENPAFVLPVFKQFSVKDTLDFFESIGIYPKERNGYYYPASEQAVSVSETLCMEAAYRQVEIYTSCNLSNIEKTKTGFLLHTGKGKIHAKSIIFATGLLASPKTGSDGSAFPYIEQLGHRFIDIVPALVQLQGKQAFFKSLAGIRAESIITLYVDGKEKQAETGELQLTDYGISGIPVFQLSRFATRALQEKKEVYTLLNFAPKLSKEQLFFLLQKRYYDYAHGKNAADALVGLFNRKLIDVLLKEAGILPQIPADTVKKAQLHKLTHTIQNLRVDIVGSKGFESAQVCAGGVDTAQINETTLESLVTPGVYFAGEVIDIDGTCGGYNLQWAWSSGYVAGIHAAGGIYDSH